MVGALLGGGKKGGPTQRVVTYNMSIHYGVCAGPIDKLWRLFYGEREFWEGPLVTQTAIPIDNPNLMGGLTKEGGVSGTLHYLPGAADQEMPSALASRLGLTTATCPGFRALASLFFVGPPRIHANRADTGVRGFYWSANSPYLRGIWAEVQCIENHENSYGWYPSKAAIPRIQDPVSEEVEEAILNPRLAQFTGAKTDPDNSVVLIEGVIGNDATGWDTYGNIAIRLVGHAVEDNMQIWTLPEGTQTEMFYGGVTGLSGSAGIHITRDGEIVVRDHATGNFHFFDVAGTLIQTVAGGTLGQFGGTTNNTWMDDIDVGGVTYMLAVSLAPFSTAALIRLRKEGVDWEKEDDRLATYVPSTLSLGTTYGYAIRVSSWVFAISINNTGVTTEVIRITLDSLAEVVVDLSSIVPGITNVTIVNYDRDNDVVVVGCANGDLYTFSADLSTVVASQTDNAFELAYRDALLCKRLSVGPSTIAVRARPGFGGSPIQDVYKLTTPDLDLIETIDVSARAYPAFDQAHSFQANNTHWNGMFLPSHFFKSPFWFLGVAPRYDMNPAHIILEALTNKRWGMGQPIASLDTTSFQDAADTLFTEQLGLSMMWTRQATIERFISEVLDHIEATLYIAPQTGLLTLKLIRDDYDPDALDIYDEDNSTCIEFQRKSMADILNEIVVSYTDPQNEQSKTVTRQDLAGIAAQGGIVSDSRDYYGVRSQTMAGRLADRDLRAGGYPLATAILEADRSGWDLVPGSVIKFSSVEHGVAQLVMRVLSVDYGRPGEPRVRLELVEDVFALEVAEFVQPPPGRWVDPGENPQPMDFTKLLTAPYMALARAGVAEDFEYPEVVVGVLGATGGTDTHAYDLYGTVTDAAGVTRLQFLGTNTVLAQGSLGVAMDAEVETDLDLGTLVDVSQGAQATVGGFALIGDNEEEGDELALVTQVVSGVATLQRGALDTVPRDWVAGRTIVFFRTSDRTYDSTVRSAGESVRYKLLPRTSRGVLDLAAAPLLPVQPFELSERPYLPLRPANVKVEDTAFGALDISLQSPAVTEFEVTWARRNRLTEDSQPLAWDAADVTPEAGQLTRVNILDAETREVLTTFDNLAGTSQVVELADFQAGLSPPPPVIIVQVQAINTTVSPPLVSLQAHEITIVVDPGVAALAIAGTPVLTGTEDVEYIGFAVTASGGAPPYTFTLEGDWPAGIEIESEGAAAAIFGTPTESGTFSTPGITVRVTDSLGDIDELTPFIIVIDDEDTTAPTLSNPTGGNVP